MSKADPRVLPNHNDILGIDGGEDGFFGHLTRRGTELVSQMETRAPDTPANLSPVDGALNVDERPLFESSAYFNVHGLPWYGYQIEISDSDGVIVFDSGNIEVAQPIYRIDPAIFLTDTEYSWRIRYQAGNLVWSEWSIATSFHTAIEFEEHTILEPDITFPGNGTTVNSPTPNITTTAFDTGSGLTQIEGDFQISTDPNFVTIIEEGTGFDSYLVQTVLSRGITYYVRARHKGQDADAVVYSSKWSPVKNFAVRQLYRGTRIGIVWDGRPAWTFSRIGDNFEPVQLDADYFPQHPLWAMLEATKTQLIDGQALSSIMRFWIYSGEAPSGPYQGKKVWLIDTNKPSDEELENGWHVHGAFLSDTFGEQDMINLSRAHLVISGGIASANEPGVGGASTVSVNNLIAACEARNTDPSDPLKRGWHVMTVIEHEALKLLMMIEFASLVGVRDRFITAGNLFHGSQWCAPGYYLYRVGLSGQTIMAPGDDISTRFAYSGRYFTGSQKFVNDLVMHEDGDASLRLGDYFLSAYRSDTDNYINATDASYLGTVGINTVGANDVSINILETKGILTSLTFITPATSHAATTKLAKRS